MLISRITRDRFPGFFVHKSCSLTSSILQPFAFALSCILCINCTILMTLRRIRLKAREHVGDFIVTGHFDLGFAQVPLADFIGRDG